ncbi:hypothetical protein [Streptomyces deccanensis]|uniref:hypothetical protein n=1 Tax=Streptomyces deccanensis TaxID=424188 RepID=UPI001EFB3A23|nr:hypothetical protein [Streptomyces deccanensis]ULR51148.1 hypothetical protein L3078_18615 [Streptomyces deccanensis]
MSWGMRAVAGACAAVLMVPGLYLSMAGPAEAAPVRYRCKAYFQLGKLGRPEAYSECWRSRRGKAVNQHRARIVCEQVQGAREHLVKWTLYGDWASPKKKSTVRCGFKNFLMGGGVETRRK